MTARPDDPIAPRCPDCDASAEWIECEVCDGDGRVVVGWNDDAYENDEAPCSPCKGEGGEWTCPTCETRTP
jgi:DnaJ-class molecular chaperone